MGIYPGKWVFPVVFILIACGVLFLNYFPHYFALTSTPKDHFFSGQASWFDPWDLNNYFGVIKEAQKEKSFFLGNLNTTDSVKPTFIYPLYSAMGILFPNVNNILLYQIFAVFFGLIFIIAIFVLSYLLLKNRYLSLLILLLVSLGGGLGFVIASASDVVVPGVTSLSNFQKPHEALAAILYFGALISHYFTVITKKPGYLILSAFSLLLLVPIYPYRIASFFIIAGAFSLFEYEKKKNFAPLVWMVVLAAIVVPITLFYALHFLSSGFSTLTSYNPLAISFVDLALGYGIFGIVFVYQLVHLQKDDSLRTFLNIWVLISLGLSVIPVGISRLYLNGILFPMAIILALSLSDVAALFKAKIPAVVVAILMLALPSSLYIFSKRVGEVENNNVWYYLPATVKDGLVFVQHTSADGVLALPPFSSYVPAWTGKHVYFGHPDQTPNYKEKTDKAIKFYRGDLTNDEAKAFLKENNLGLVLATSTNESEDAPPYSFLRLVYHNRDVQIFSW